jgi:hypothetical protein
VFRDGFNTKYVSASLDGRTEFLRLQLQEDGKPSGHPDILDLKLNDPARIAETQRQMEISRRLRLARKHLVNKVSKRPQRPTPRKENAAPFKVGSAKPNEAIDLVEPDQVQPFQLKAFDL